MGNVLVCVAVALYLVNLWWDSKDRIIAKIAKKDPTLPLD